MTGRCDSVRDELAAYQSGEGNTDERATIASHLQTCVVCQQEEKAQKLMRDALRALKTQTASAQPPPYIWKNAARAWNQRDAHKRVRVQVRIALAGAFLLLFAFGAVWARMARHTDFPVVAALHDFAQAQQETEQPAFASPDADRAAQWLRKRLGGNIPAMHLDAVGAHLIGTDIIAHTTPATGRLLYHTNQGVMALYVTPGGTNFGSLRTVVMSNYAFREDSRDGNYGILGWSRNGIGYGLALQKPLEDGKVVAAEACRTTE